MGKKKWFFDPLIPLAYNVILADPPWKFKNFTPFDSEKGPQYPVMADPWIRSLPMRDLAADGCLLWLWATYPKLDFAMDCLKHEWGFRYVTGGSWHKVTRTGKTRRGPGKVVATCAEPWLLGRIGRPVYIKKPIQGVLLTEEEYDEELVAMLEGDEGFDGLHRGHSRKPDEQYDRIDQLMGTECRRCELFGRQQWPGYETWGNEIHRFEAESEAE